MVSKEHKIWIAHKREIQTHMLDCTYPFEVPIFNTKLSIDTNIASPSWTTVFYKHIEHTSGWCTFLAPEYFELALKGAKATYRLCKCLKSKWYYVDPEKDIYICMACCTQYSGQYFEIMSKINEEQQPKLCTYCHTKPVWYGYTENNLCFICWKMMKKKGIASEEALLMAGEQLSLENIQKYIEDVKAKTPKPKVKKVVTPLYNHTEVLRLVGGPYHGKYCRVEEPPAKYKPYTHDIFGLVYVYEPIYDEIVLEPNTSTEDSGLM